MADSFIEAACIPMDGSAHTSGSLDEAKAILSDHPEIAAASIHTAAVLGNDSAVIQFLRGNPATATARGGPYGWDALTYLCFSRYLRLDKSRSEGFVSAAAALLDSGADPNAGFFSDDHLPNPTFESVIYGAAGVAHHAALTKLLLDRGADPNDGETEYHAPEGFDNEPMEIIVRSGKLKPIGLTTMLHRKLDWTDYDAVIWLLEHGADANAVSHWGGRALHHSLGRDNHLKFFEALLDQGADPRLESKHGVSAYAAAALMGRGDVLDLFDKRGLEIPLEGAAGFLAACARGDADSASAMVRERPELIDEAKAAAPSAVPHFAGAGNTAGLKILLDNGFDIESRTSATYPKGFTALHLATWRERDSTVALLLERGAAIEAATPRGDTPLSLAVQAMVEMSEWTPHESTAILERLLTAGADVSMVRKFPSGSEEADDLLRRFGKMA